MITELDTIRKIYKSLLQQEERLFPMPRKKLVATTEHGVYIILNEQNSVLHVGKTARAKNGISQRLYNHLHGNSSFTMQYLEKDGSRLRGLCKYKYIEVPDARTRALLESYTISHLCPEHLGLGE